jgi:hypothetical protein
MPTNLYQRHWRQNINNTSLANFSTIFTSAVDTCQRYRRQIATGINDTGGKFATGVNDTGG